jgi:hypothetical protein
MFDLARRIDVSDLEAHQVAATQLAINGEVEQRQLASPLSNFEADSDRPDVLRL